MKTFFIADLHFGHKNCLAYDNREFPDVETHDAELIRRWNNAVGFEDDAWILGDVSWYGAMKTVSFLKEMNGRKHLCIGNHDEKLLKCKEFRDQFVEITNYKELAYNDVGIVLCHYPIPCYKNHFYGWYHLYGHVHTSFEWNMMKQDSYELNELYCKGCRMYNVGCMVPGMAYTPRTLEEIVCIFGER